MKELALINPENVSTEEAQSYRTREAARAVVFDETNLVALLHATKNLYYKLPGGGLDENEDAVAALKRECLEEIGCDIEVTEELGLTIEYRRKYGLKQTSYCYVAKLVGRKGVPDLTDDEIAEGFQTVWLPLDEAIKAVAESTPIVYEGIYMNSRDKIILEIVRDSLN